LRGGTKNSKLFAVECCRHILLFSFRRPGSATGWTRLRSWTSWVFVVPRMY